MPVVIGLDDAWRKGAWRWHGSRPVDRTTPDTQGQFAVDVGIPLETEVGEDHSLCAMFGDGVRCDPMAITAARMGTVTGQVYYLVQFLGSLPIKNPIADAEVEISGTDTLARTDARGYYSMTLASGDHTVWAWKSGWVAGTADTTVRPGETSTADIRLDLGATRACEGPQSIASLQASLDAFPGEDVGTFLVFPNGQGVEVSNTFSVTLRPDAIPALRVDFGIFQEGTDGFYFGGWDEEGDDGWQTTAPMSHLLPSRGDTARHRLVITPYALDGRMGCPKTVGVRVVRAPQFAVRNAGVSSSALRPLQEWIADESWSFDPAEGVWTFSGIIPATPRFRPENGARYDHVLPNPPGGTLSDSYSTDGNVSEQFSLDGTWTGWLWGWMEFDLERDDPAAPPDGVLLPCGGWRAGLRPAHRPYSHIKARS